MNESARDQAWGSTGAMLAAPAILCALSFAFSILLAPLVGPIAIAWSFGFSVIFVPVAWLVLFIVGWPLFSLFYMLGVRGVWPLATCALLAGAAGGLIFHGLTVGSFREAFAFFPMVGAVSGALVAALAWWLRRPDLDPD